MPERVRTDDCLSLERRRKTSRVIGRPSAADASLPRSLASALLLRAATTAAAVRAASTRLCAAPLNLVRLRCLVSLSSLCPLTHARRREARPLAGAVRCCCCAPSAALAARWPLQRRRRPCCACSLLAFPSPRRTPSCSASTTTTTSRKATRTTCLRRDGETALTSTVRARTVTEPPATAARPPARAARRRTACECCLRARAAPGGAIERRAALAPRLPSRARACASLRAPAR